MSSLESACSFRKPPHGPYTMTPDSQTIGALQPLNVALWLPVRGGVRTAWGSR
jgi:hypothetical protein